MNVELFIIIIGIYCLISIAILLCEIFEYASDLEYMIVIINASLSIILLILSCVISYNMDKKCVREEEPYAIQHIVALQDNNKMSSRYYARHTYINEKMYYQYLRKQNDGSIIMTEITAYDTPVFFDDDARVEWYYSNYKFLFLKKQKVEHILYIPEGSILEEYNIDCK